MCITGSLFDEEDHLTRKARAYTTDSGTFKKNHPLMIMVNQSCVFMIQDFVNTVKKNYTTGATSHQFITTCYNTAVLLYSETKITVLKVIHVYYTSFIFCEIIYIRWTFNFVYFVGRAIHEFKIRTKYLFIIIIIILLYIIVYYSNIAYNLKSKNLSVHKYVQCCQTTKFTQVVTSVLAHPCILSPQVNTKREDLLAHPLVTALLRYKWTKFGRTFYYVNFFIYAVFLTFLTGYVVTTDAPYMLYVHAVQYLRSNFKGECFNC